MSVLKYKNSQGNWVEAPGVYCGNGALTLKEETITKIDTHTFDLTKYQHIARFWVMISLAQGGIDYVKYVFDPANDMIMKNQPENDYGSLHGIQGVVNVPTSSARSMFTDASGDGYMFTYEDGILRFSSFNLTNVPVNVGSQATIVYPDFV